MCSRQPTVNGIISLIYCVLAIFVCSIAAELSITFERSTCHYEGEDLVLVASYSGVETVDTIDWYFDKQSSGNNIVFASNCQLAGFADPGYPNSRITYSCDTGTNTYKATIADLNVTENGVWGVFLTFANGVTTTTETETFTLCTECFVQTVENGDVNATQTSVLSATVIGVTCHQGYVLNGINVLTCQNSGQWNSLWPTCKRTATTSTTTTTITSSTTSMMTSSAIAATTSSLRISTTNISTSTTSTMAQSAATSIKSTSRGTITRTSPVTSTVPNASDRDSVKAIVTMIIVVSIIGGILIVAIFSIMFVMMHWKSCFTRRGQSKQYIKRSDHRKQHRQAEYNFSGRFNTIWQDHAMRGYYFYNGTYKNPLFYDPFENSSYMNNYNSNQKNSHDPKYMSSHEAYQYN